VDRSNGSYLAQIADEKINGGAIHNSPAQVGAIRLGMVWFGERWRFFTNEYDEFGARNRPTGQKVVLRIARIF
jgi:hypothetical protein